MSGGAPPPSPFGFGLQAFAEFWGQAGKAALQTQEIAGRAFTDAMKAMPQAMLPGLSSGGASGPAGLPWPVPGADGGGAALPAAFAPDAAELTRAGQAIAELWTTAATLSGTLAQAVLAASSGGGGGAGKPGDPTVDASFRAMTDPRTWLASVGGMDSVVGRVAEGPQLADLWSAERQQARAVQAWLDVRRRGLEHNAVVLEAWVRAARAFSEELAGRTRADGRATPDGKAMLALWTETANRVLLETQRSEPFLRTQAAMIRAGTELKLAQRDLAERWASQFGLPTRTELDDVHRTVTELKREVRRLRREADRPAPVVMPREGGASMSSARTDASQDVDAMRSHGMTTGETSEAAKAVAGGKAKSRSRPNRAGKNPAGKE